MMLGWTARTSSSIQGSAATSTTTSPHSYTSHDPSLPDDRYLDRELSWLAFNQRVLELAEDPDLPLLERANFLAIFASNLDEFFMVRVAGLKRRIATGLAVPTNVGRAPHDVLADICEKAHELQERHARVFRELVQAGLDEAGIDVVSWDDLDDGRPRPMRRDLLARRSSRC